MDRVELRECIASSRYIAATYDPNAGHLQPLQYTRGLARAATSRGVNIFEHTRALAHRRHDGRIVVRTAAGEVVARHLALCGNAALGHYSRELARKIMGVATYIIATEPLGEACARELIRNNAAVTDTNFVLDYFRRSADHRLLFGGRVSYSGLDPLGTTRATRARMLQVFPQLADARIEHAWGGYVDITMNRAPHFGRLEPDVYFVQGFSGHGIALTGIAGKLLAEAIGGTSERFDVFSRIPHHDFPGGDTLRRPLLVLAMLWYRLRDWL
jgi:gamma-glutamylputrescine oxidase